jgi:lipoprotein NlpD
MKLLVLIGIFLGLGGCATLSESPVDNSKISIKTIYYEKYYQVKRGDTLSKIAHRHGLKASDLATWNGLRPPYQLHAGQILRLFLSSTNSIISAPPTACAPIQWQTPTNGQAIRKISRTGREAIEITGNLSQTIFAAADGHVAYSGNGVQRYAGGLIILNHSKGWHSVYAHTQQRLVAAGTTVKRGQPIATLGGNSRRRPVLYFEIRCGRQTLNPLHYLSEK